MQNYQQYSAVLNHSGHCGIMIVFISTNVGVEMRETNQQLLPILQRLVM